MQKKILNKYAEALAALETEEEKRAFLEIQKAPSFRGIRANLLKISSREELSALFPEENLKPVPFCGEGLFINENNTFSQSPYYAAGLYYIQEPSAMAAVYTLAPKPGDFVLDLCAAPGGKSVQIAGYLKGQGFLLSNDTSASRALALVKNLQTAGANALITAESPQSIAANFPEFFDKILVDAPCSGEGMFRRDSKSKYEANKPEKCHAMQVNILKSAGAALKPGGTLLYSTCTFNRLENEGSIEIFLRDKNFELLQTRRIWPHKEPGEGAFIALVKKIDSFLKIQVQKREIKKSAFSQEQKKIIFFLPEIFENAPSLEENINLIKTAKGERLYIPAIDLSPEKRLRVLRNGLILGDFKTGRNIERFEPSQALALYPDFSPKYYYEADYNEAQAYLRGESLSCEEFPKRDWVLIKYNGYGLGFAKSSGKILKNKKRGL